MSFQIPIGPQHPALKEPISLRMTVEGEVITDVDIRLGYNHRGLEKLAEDRNWIQNIYLVERICGICSHSHATCYVQGVEKLMELTPPKRGMYIRYLVSELERIHSHLLWLGVAGHEAGFDSFFMYTWRDREVVMDLLEMISGNRVHYAINTIGGVRRDLDAGQIAKIREGLVVLKKRSEYYFHIGANEPSFVGRIAGVGILPKETAIALCAVGPTARASGWARDVRKEDPYAAYDDVEFEVATADSCDVLGRVVVRVKELLESYKICEQLLDKLPPGDIAVRAPRKAKPGEVVARYEAPRGENIHYIKSNGTDKPERLKVRAPTLANYPATVEMLRKGFIADIPLIFAAIDPCICCAERTVTLIAARSGEESVVRMSDLRRRAIARHQNAPVKRNAAWPL
ncbi:MAG: nickel-dependent hydrogenase large subunit [Candidatus Aminicenantes bacterium]|nr:nickel-dependent hydrogenase large subunit [Candidatus Aminicenantes bacterium]MCJ7488242.1 nickel-dependent hydrogenase large subunit [Candidatus Aminicenantes bacterium]